MSKYTTEVRFICETTAGLTSSAGFSDIDTVLSDVNVAKVMNGISYPIFDEAYRAVLNKKILMHYYTREIGFETVGLWKLKLRTRLNEIMPYYNQLYESELLEFNPLYDVDYTKNYDKNGTGNKQDDSSEIVNEDNTNDVSRTSALNSEMKSNTTNQTTTSGETSNTANRTKDSTNMYSETPQGKLTDVVAGNYLTNATVQKDTDSTTDNGTSSGTANGTTSYKDSNQRNTNENEVANYNSNRSNVRSSKGNSATTEKYLESVKGKMSTESYSKRLKEFRETFLNIDRMVIEELSDLFFGLWE